MQATETQEQFELLIDMGNAAVQTPIDVADLLHAVARKLASEGWPEGREGIRDLNGNAVGSYSLDS